jgi:hypothetical protein
LLTPAFAEAVALCVIFGVIPLIGFSLLVQSIRQSVRSGRLETYSRGGIWHLYYRADDQIKFWFALSFKAVPMFALCAFPFILCVLFFLPRLITIVRTGGGP